MNRQQKVAVVERLADTMSRVPHVILTTFRGLTVNQETILRTRIREAGGRYAVVNNRLAIRAAAGTPLEPLTLSLRGPCAMASHATNPVALAKVLSAFVKENPQLEIVAGVVDAKDVVDAAAVRALASLPGLNELRAQILALVQTPATSLVRLLSTPATQLSRVLDARREQREGAS